MRHIVAVVLLLVGCSGVRSAESAGYSANVRTTCGQADGGAYEIDLAAGDRTITIHAENNRTGKWSLERDFYQRSNSDFSLRVCGADYPQCVTPQSGSLSIQPAGKDRLLGHVSFVLPNAAHVGLNFHGVIPKRDSW